MMASREWMYTKIIAAVLGTITLISVCVSTAGMIVDLKNDVMRIDGNQVAHEQRDEQKWEKAWADIDENADDIHELELQNTRIETNQKEILRRLDEIHTMITKFEVVD